MHPFGSYESYVLSPKPADFLARIPALPASTYDSRQPPQCRPGAAWVSQEGALHDISGLDVSILRSAQRSSRQLQICMGEWTIEGGAAIPVAIVSPQVNKRSIGIHPSYPGAAILAKCNLPCRLKRLKILIRLKEGSDAQRIQYSECDQEQEDVTRYCRASACTLYRTFLQTFVAFHQRTCIARNFCRGLRRRC